jgi:hypothetical protein
MSLAKVVSFHKFSLLRFEQFSNLLLLVEAFMVFWFKKPLNVHTSQIIDFFTEFQKKEIFLVESYF